MAQHGLLLRHRVLKADYVPQISLDTSAASSRISSFEALRSWGKRQWLTALGATVVYVLVVGLPTDLIPNPIFGREIPPTWWSWPSLLLSAVLLGLLVGTYVNLNSVSTEVQPSGVSANEADLADPDTRRGLVAGMLTFFAVGCPVCNKVVLLALGSAGAIKWFEPMQPLLQVGAVALLVWALRTRLRNQLFCTVPAG